VSDELRDVCRIAARVNAAAQLVAVEESLATEQELQPSGDLEGCNGTPRQRARDLPRRCE